MYKQLIKTVSYVSLYLILTSTAKKSCRKIKHQQRQFNVAHCTKIEKAN